MSESSPILESILAIQSCADRELRHNLILQQLIQLSECDVGALVRCKYDYPEPPSKPAEESITLKKAESYYTRQTHDSNTSANVNRFSAPSQLQVSYLLNESVEPTTVQYSEAPFHPPRKAFGTSLLASKCSWSGATDEIWRQTLSEQRCFHQFESGLAYVQATHSPYLYSKLQPTDFPEGHELMSSFLWAPLLLNTRLVGVVGIGLKLGSVDMSLVEDLKPLLAFTASVLFEETFPEVIYEPEPVEIEEQPSQGCNEFFMSLSQQMRSSLKNGIRTIKLLHNTDLNGKQFEYLEAIELHNIQLLELANDLMDFSKLSLNQLKLNYLPVDVRQTLENSYAVSAPKTRNKNIELSFSIDDNMPSFIKTDPKRLQQIIVNLLSNALKFTLKGYILTTATAKLIEKSLPNKYELQFAVKDTGTGMTPEQQARVFDCFSSTRRSESSSLGLTISKELVELLGGNIWITSVKGVGTTFHFTIVAEEYIDVTALSKRASMLLSAKEVLIVENDPISRMVLFNLVLSWKMQPYLASTKEEALLFVEVRKFELGFIHVETDNGIDSFMEGVQLAQAIKKRGYAFPLIAMSTKSTEFSGNHLFSKILIKPINETRLFSVVHQVLFKSLPDENFLKKNPTTPTYDLRVLLVENTYLNEKIIETTLTKLGCSDYEIVHDQITPVENIKYAKRAGWPYDVIFIDISLPLINTDEIFHEISNIYPSRRDRPFLIAIVPYMDDNQRHRLRANEVNGYLKEPINPTELETMLQVIYEKKTRHATPPTLNI